MSLLQVETEYVHDDPSAHGEDLAKGSGHIYLAAAIAFVVLSVAIGAFYMAIRKPIVATGEVTRVWAHAVHTLNTPLDAAGVPTPGQAFDQVLVFSQISLHNKSDKPIVLKEMLTNITLEDGIHSSYAATATDYDRIFIAYKELIGLKTHTLVRDTILQPGQTLEGMIVSSFHVSQEQWAARKDLSITIQLKSHPDLVLIPKVAIIEQ